MKRCFPFYLNIVTVFSILIVAIVSAVVLYGYLNNSSAALVSARQLLMRAGDSVSERSRFLFDTAFDTTDIYVDFPGIAEKGSLHSHPMSHVFFRFLEQHPDFTSLFIGFDDGDFHLVSSLHGREGMKRRLGIPESAVWYTQTIGHLTDGTRYEMKKYLNAGFVTVGSSVTRGVEYDPRERCWFQSARERNEPTLSDVYVFSLSGEPGITVSHRFESKVSGVFGIDLSLSNLCRFVRRQSMGDNSEIAIFDTAGNVYAYSDLDRLVRSLSPETRTAEKEPPDTGTEAATEIDRLGVPSLSALVTAYKEHGNQGTEAGELSVDNVRYLYRVDPLSDEYHKDLFVAVAVPEERFTAPIAAIGKQTLLVSLALLVLTLPVIYGVAKLISRPLILLTGSVENIRSFNLRVPVSINTFILEIRDLAAALETMRSSLKAFGSYVPRPLVERMITNDISPALGGDRRELTLLFSDIEGFTSLSEGMSPETLTAEITEYFRRISQVILHTKGTVDKYIGDAVMAFWNAPVRNAAHAHDACLAALRCRSALRIFNRRRRESGRPEFKTRMGIHTGEAVVGNIGSADRMAYTAIGESVNLASRLEGLNKYLGSSILVSESTRRAAGENFVFRFAGRVVPKGTSAGVGVYELLGTRYGSTGVYAPLVVEQGVEARLVEWDACFALLLAREFEAAAEGFQTYLDNNGPDRLAGHFLELARTFTTRPPAADWKGEQIFDAK
ncbi:adenylate/guanylate cyclase domain-containing protein [uncultured Pseudodesulfovibrio sp.]|uniref:adenylate/guanylate cyclase domain-containing protein n=1 Tax=uncultured Pseudodesulfovibrio sp. TaxID=2035858 RepID=UPI0029C6407A|nr:adenylate/guanylate cyclase domain-containing protein [uncultured Pseudodesulfovibrio sp.]